jgi:hypothetical protein
LALVDRLFEARPHIATGVDDYFACKGSSDAKRRVGDPRPELIWKIRIRRRRDSGKLASSSQHQLGCGALFGLDSGHIVRAGISRF